MLKGMLGVSMLIFWQIGTAQLHEGLNNSTIRVAIGADKQEANAVIWLPPGYTGGKKYPLIIYGHGIEQADTDINKLYTDGLPAILKGGFQPPFDCIIICPQRASYGVIPEWLPGILEDAARRFSIDSTRVYLTGTSAGGYLCYGSQLNVSPELGRKIAAICVVSGATQDANRANMDWWVKNKTPLWAIVGEQDKGFLHQNIYMINAINQRLPGIARVSIRAGVGHGAWLSIYDGSFRDGGMNIWSWLYQFKTLPPTPLSRPDHPAKTVRPSAPASPSRITVVPPGKRKTRIILRVQDNQVYSTDIAKEYDVRPGDTLVIPTGIASVLLRNFKGEAGKPIVLLPKDSGWIGGYSSYAMVITNAKYFKVTGFHIDGLKKSDLGLAIGEQTSDYEVARCSIRNSVAMGLMAKQNPDNAYPEGSWPAYSIRNVSIHDITVRNTGTEGFYIGYTFDIIKPLASPLVNVDIYRIDIDSTGWDGLQLSNCQQVFLHDVNIRHYGLKDQSSQQGGLLIGGMVTLRDSLFNVTVSNGTGAGLLIFGRGLMKCNNIALTKVGMSAGEHAIYVNDYPDLGYGLPPLQLQMKNIRVNGSAGKALMVTNERKTMKPGRIERFSYVNTGSGIMDEVDKVTR
jgi:hypothetical protein